MPFRTTKIVLVAGIALWTLLVVFGNLTDYASNFEFVRHVLSMDTVRPEARIHYRAITLPALHHAFYALIILAELIVASLMLAGTWAMWRARRAPAAEFAASKRLAALGLAWGLALWLGGFMAIGGEWFAMWLSGEWNALGSAFRFVVVLLLALIHLAQPESQTTTG